MATWLLTVLFYLGVFFIVLGLALIVMPKAVMGWGESMNRWVSTNLFFNSLDAPRNHERIFYKYHRLFGIVIILGSAFSIYFLMIRNGVRSTAESVASLSDSLLASWLLETGYYILSGGCILAIMAGIIIFLRPSVLKSVESWGNRWIDTGSRLEQFDRVHEIPTNVLPGKPRIFGVFVLLSSIYIVYITGTRIF